MILFRDNVPCGCAKATRIVETQINSVQCVGCGREWPTKKGREQHGAEQTITTLHTRIAELEAVLREADEILALCTTRTFDALPEDPIAREWGERLGYGALMSAASKEWRAYLARVGMPAGGQHTCGPCEATVTSIRERIAAVLPPTEEG